MIIGFGFGNPLVSIAMLLLTSGASYLVFRVFHRSRVAQQSTKKELYQYYQEQRRYARELSAKFDLSDEEIEQKIEDELRK